ncbi:MAG: hypothetical protein WDW36_002104 [Sanguina aurantia]
MSKVLHAGASARFDGFQVKGAVAVSGLTQIRPFRFVNASEVASPGVVVDNPSAIPAGTIRLRFHHSVQQTGVAAGSSAGPTTQPGSGPADRAALPSLKEGKKWFMVRRMGQSWDSHHMVPCGAKVRW